MSDQDSTPAENTSDTEQDPEFDEQAAAGLSDEEYLAAGAAAPTE